MPEGISWEFIIRETGRIFTNAVPKNRIVASASAYFSLRANLENGVQPHEIANLLQDEKYVQQIVKSVGKRRRTEQMSVLSNIEESNGRLEIGIVELQAATLEIREAAKAITARTESIENATIVSQEVAQQNARTARTLTHQIANLRRHARTTNETLAHVIRGQGKKIGITVGVITGTAVAFFPGMPLNMASSYFYERYWSKDARGETKPQTIILKLVSYNANGCLPADNFKKLSEGRSITLAAGSTNICITLPKIPTQPAHHHHHTNKNRHRAKHNCP